MKSSRPFHFTFGCRALRTRDCGGRRGAQEFGRRYHETNRYLAGCSCRDGWRCRLHGSRIWTNDLRAILDNDVAIKAYRERKLPFPNGTIIVRLAWSYVPSEENNKVF